MAIRKATARNPKGNPVDDEDVAFSEGVARRIRTLCELRGYSYRDLERKIGCSDGTIAQLCSGRRAGSTTLKLVHRIAKALHASLDFICDGHVTHRGKGISDDEPTASQTAFQFEQPAAKQKRARRQPKSRTKKPPR